MIHTIKDRPTGVVRWMAAILILLIPCSPIKAAVDYTVETIPNIRLSNARDHVSNPDGIITSEDVGLINAYLNALEDSLGIEVAVVAVESIGEQEVRSFATDLFNHWKLGRKKEDNGLLIQLVTDSLRHSVVFETGYGIEGVLPDAICYRLQQQYMIPDLRTGAYSIGMRKGVQAVCQYLLASDYERSALMDGYSDRMTEEDVFLWMFGLFTIGIIGIAMFFAYMKYRPQVCPRCGQRTLVYKGVCVIQEATHFSQGLSEEIFRCSTCGYTRKRRHTTDRIHPNGGGSLFMGGGGGGFSGGGEGGSWGGGSSGGGGSMSRF